MARQFFVPAAVDDMGLSVSAYRMYCHFLVKAGAGQYRESIDRIAETCNMNRKTAYKALEELEQHRLVNVERSPGMLSVFSLTKENEWVAGE